MKKFFVSLIPAAIVGILIAGSVNAQVSSPNYFKKQAGYLLPNTASTTIGSSTVDGSFRNLTIGSSTVSPVTDKGGQVYNFKAYGAKGDGVTDDSAAIQSAFSAASSTGGTVLCPAGTYNMPTTSVNVSSSNITFSGSGYSCDLVLGNHVGFNFTNVSNVVVSGIRLDATANTSGDKALYFKNPVNDAVINSWVLNAGSFALFIDTTGTSTYGPFVAQGNYLSGRGIADVFGGGPQNNSSTLGQLIIVNNVIVQDNTVTTTDMNAIDIVAQNKTIIANNITTGRIVLGGEKIPHYHVDVVNNVLQPALGNDYTSITVLASNASSTANSTFLSILGNQILNGQVYLQGNGPTNSTTTEVLVQNNNIEASVDTGSELNEGIVFHNIKNAIVSGNIVKNASTSVFLGSTDSITITANIFASTTTAIATSGTNLNTRILNNLGYSTDNLNSMRTPEQE